MIARSIWVPAQIGYVPRQSVAPRGWGRWTGGARRAALRRPWTGPGLGSGRIQALWFCEGGCLGFGVGGWDLQDGRLMSLLAVGLEAWTLA